MCNKCEKKKYKYYKSDFGISPIKTKHMDLVFDMFEDKTIVNSSQKMEVLENLSEIKLDAWDIEILEIKLADKLLNFDYNKEERFVVVKMGKEYAKGQEFFLEIKSVTNPTKNILEGLYYDTTPKGCPSHQITQCQQWGFRRLVPCVDDMTTKCTYKTTIIADSRYTNLITNGDIEFERTTITDGRDKIVYKNDKVPMATYLFFLGAGTWETYTREFEYPNGDKFELELLLKPATAKEEEARKSLEVTADGIMYIHLFTGRDKYKNWEKSLKIYELCKKRDELKRSLQAQRSQQNREIETQLAELRAEILQKSSDLTFGYKYTGTVYREIAMENTNIGGMENVGNTTVRSDSIVPYKYMADRGLEYLFAIKTHEFYHNLNGSEVTGFSPFEFWLNEAVTVLIESEYSDFTFGKDYHRMQTVQQIIAPIDGVLAQDDGPLTKAIQPEGFNHPDELVNSIIYVKSVEFVRMVQTILGKENFVQALADYHQKFRFSNAKTEDWLEAMQKYTTENIKDFSHTWLKKTGYPVVNFVGEYSKKDQTYTINLSQKPSNSRDEENKLWQYPFKFALCQKNGEEIYQETILVKEKSFRLVVDNVQNKPAFVSVNRDFGFYGRLERKTDEDELYVEIKNDKNRIAQNLAFVELAEKIKINLMQQLEGGVDKNNLQVDQKFVDLYFEILANSENQIDLGTMALALFSGLYDTKYAHKYEETYQVGRAISKAVGKKYEEELLKIYNQNSQKTFQGSYIKTTPEEIKNRAVKNLALALAAKNNNPEILEFIKKTYFKTENWTDKLALFNIYVNSEALDKMEIVKDLDKISQDHFLARKSFLFSLARMEADDVIDILTQYSFNNPDFDWNLSNNQLIFVVFSYNRRKSLLTKDGREFLEKFLLKIALLNDYTTGHILEILSDMEYLEKSVQDDLKSILKKIQTQLDPKKHFATYNNINLLLN